jgi:hypothetical protein
MKQKPLQQSMPVRQVSPSSTQASSAANARWLPVPSFAYFTRLSRFFALSFQMSGAQVARHRLWEHPSRPHHPRWQLRRNPLRRLPRLRMRAALALRPALPRSAPFSMHSMRRLGRKKRASKRSRLGHAQLRDDVAHHCAGRGGVQRQHRDGTEVTLD